MYHEAHIYTYYMRKCDMLRSMYARKPQELRGQIMPRAIEFFYKEGTRYFIRSQAPWWSSAS